MKKLSIKQWSLLGLVLFVASAVTAAVIPAKKDKKALGQDDPGRLQDGIESDNQTCITTDGIDPNCHETTTAGENSTTSVALDTSNDAGVDLDGNTTDDADEL